MDSTLDAGGGYRALFVLRSPGILGQQLRRGPLLSSVAPSPMTGKRPVSEKQDLLGLSPVELDEALAAHDSANTVGMALNDIRALVSGKRKIINAGANEELYDKSDVLRYTFNLTKEAGTDNYTQRSV